MQAQRWEQLCDLFATLTTIASEERESFMRTACGGDLDLCEELVSLLDSHRTRGFLDAAPEFILSDTDASEPGELPGAHVACLCFEQGV